MYTVRSENAAQSFLQTQAAQNKITRHQIMHHTLKFIINEILVFWQYWYKLYIVKKEESLKDVSIDNSHTQDDSRYRTLRKSIKIQLSHHWDSPVGINDAFKKFLLDLWNPNHDNRLSQTFEPILRQIAGILPDTWKIAIESGEWNSLLTPLFKTTIAVNKFDMKKIVPDLCSRHLLAINKLIALAQRFHPKIVSLSESSSNHGLDYYYELFFHVLAVWPNFIIHYWKPVKLIDHKYLYSKQGLGVESVINAWMNKYGLSHPDRYNNRNKLIETSFPLTAWSFAGSISKIPDPQGLHWDEIDQIEWVNPISDEQHPWLKDTPLAAAMAIRLYTLCKDECSEAYGNYRFHNGRDFQSELYNGDTMENSVQEMYANFDLKHKIISDNSTNKCKNVLKSMIDFDCKLGTNIKTLKISRYLGELMDSGIC